MGNMPYGYMWVHVGTLKSLKYQMQYPQSVNPAADPDGPHGVLNSVFVGTFMDVTPCVAPAFVAPSECSSLHCNRHDRNNCTWQTMKFLAVSALASLVLHSLVQSKRKHQLSVR